MHAKENLTRAALAAAISDELGVSQSKALTLVDSIIRSMGEALGRGENVKVSRFGSFLLRDKTARIGRNPKTLEEVPIKPRRMLTFRASSMLRQRVAGG